MKKILGISLILILVVASLTGCGSSSGNTTTNPPVTYTAPATVPPPATTTAPPATTAAPPTTSSGNTLSELLGKAAGLTNFYCEIKITSSTGIQNMKEWTKLGNPTKLRMEIAVPGQGTTIMIYDTQFYYMYDPATKMAFKLSLASAQQYTTASSDASAVSQYSPLLIGSETVNGMDCAVYQYTVQGVITKMWIWKQYGLPVKVVAGTTTMEYTNFSFAVIADSMFQLPSDAILVTIPGM